MYIVLYEAFYGHKEVFGNFKTIKEAKDWMNKDVQYNIENAAKDGVTLIANTTNNGNMIEIDDYGIWEILPENVVM